jgi:hypothetical protein
MYLQALKKPDVSISFDITAQGRRYKPTWGLDLAWINEQNLRKGVNHMGLENVGIGRTSFRVFSPLTNDTELTTEMVEGLRERTRLFDNIVDKKLPLVFNCDNGYEPYSDYPQTHINTYYTVNRQADAAHWAANIVAHIRWMRQSTEHPIVGVSPMNEPDFDGNKGELIQGTAAGEAAVAAKLRTDYASDMEGVILAGGNTLNNDKALPWYNAGRQYYDWGNTHQLAGSMDNYIAFHDQLQKDGKVGYNDEMHNIVELMTGLEHGLTVGIWWGFDSRARGELCQVSRHGDRLAYGEHRANWTAASVWRHDDGRVKAFVGGSERQAVNTTYQLVSVDRPVYYDGYGPVHEYQTVINGGTGYQKGQTNAERVIDITWGEDVAPSVLNGTYRLWNKASLSVLAFSATGGNITMQRFAANNQRQQWTVKPVTARSNGDLSFLDIESVQDSNIRLNVKNYSTKDNENLIAWKQESGPTSNEQWYAEYAGNGYYYLRNRESALYMALSANGTDVVQRKMPAQVTTTELNRMQWRLLPTDVKSLTIFAPAAPSGLTATAHRAAVTLTWTANTESDLEGYMVLRRRQDDSQWYTIARCLKTPQFTDNTCEQGVTYEYKVRAIDREMNYSRTASDPVTATPTGERGLVAQWGLQQDLYDATPNLMDCQLSGTPTYVDGRDEQKALYLRGSQGQYLQLPYTVANSRELTVTMWVKLLQMTDWQRLFDFGNDQDHYLFLTAAGGGGVRFGIKNGGSEQTVTTPSKLPMGIWKHVALTIGNGRVTIYQDGEQAAMSDAITITPADIRPVLNYIGRSQFLSDPLLYGHLSDVRIYNYALTADEVKTVMGGADVTAVDTPRQVTQAPHTQHQATVYGLDGIERNRQSQGLSIVGGKKVLKIFR